MSRLSPNLQSFLESRANAMNDGNTDLGSTLSHLAREDLFRAGIPSSLGGQGNSFAEAMLLIADVAYHCLTSAFVFWGQRVFAEYLVQSENEWLKHTLLPRILSGECHGATGLSNAIKNLAGIETLQVRAQLNGDSLTLNGALPWISNVPENRFVAAAASQGKESAVHIVAFPANAEGLHRSDDLKLLGLRASATARLELRNVRLDTQWLIAEDGTAFLNRVRALFLLLQCGLSVGLIRRILDEVERLHPRESSLKKRHGAASVAFEKLKSDWLALATADFIHGSDSIKNLFRTRIALSDLALSVIHLELQAVGGRGYLQSSGTERRWREIAFIPVVTPSVTQLANELTKLDRSNFTVKSSHERNYRPTAFIPAKNA
ncbi:MAG: acyl-CoA dehydrogenase [Gammaproteobacteria bacterium HGW-Gammaproteobacteria-10]|nr:MAG: acyl-CoA dehydrogenase [Gammaproteobacteria bacterium HGW-Gammaproteobacteria-10]